jgi:hypothetical protein
VRRSYSGAGKPYVLTRSFNSQPACGDNPRILADVALGPPAVDSWCQGKIAPERPALRKLSGFWQPRTRKPLPWSSKEREVPTWEVIGCGRRCTLRPQDHFVLESESDFRIILKRAWLSFGALARICPSASSWRASSELTKRAPGLEAGQCFADEIGR